MANANTAQPSFIAPDVAPGDTVLFTFELTVSDAEDSASDSITIYVAETLPLVTVAGRLTYERPTFTSSCRLDFAASELRPVRLATVWLLDGSNTVLGQTTTDLDGNYAFSSINAFTDVRVRVRAELVQTTGPQTSRLPTGRSTRCSGRRSTRATRTSRTRTSRPGRDGPAAATMISSDSRHRSRFSIHCSTASFS